MKNRYKIIILIILTFNQFIESGWNPFSGWGNKIKKGVTTITNKVKEGFNKGVDKAKACAEVVTLGTEWAAKQAALQTAKGVLEAAKKLQKTDPRLIGLLTAQKTAEIALDAAQKTLDIAQTASSGIAKATQLLSDIVSKGFVVDSITFQTTSEDLLKQKPLPLHIIGTIAGQHFDKVMHDLDFSSSDSFIKSILKNLGW